MKLSGIFVALVTPMNNSGDINWQELSQLIQWHIEHNTPGLIIAGTTGESSTLSQEEHINLIKFSIDCAKGKIKIIAGTGANNTTEAIWLHQHAATLGADASLSVVPYYNKPPQAGIIAHFNAIANSHDLPLILYNVPHRTVVDLEVDSVCALSSHPNIIGIKDASGDVSRVAQYRQRIIEAQNGDGDFILLSGDDSSMFEFIQAGGHGAISVSANVAPMITRKIFEYCQQNKWDEAKKIDKELLQTFHKKQGLGSNPAASKWALHKLGYLQSAYCRLPQVMLDEQLQLEIEDAISPFFNEVHKHIDNSHD